ncbi:hypothetical protein P8452_67596 [Trifolium repens]|nr:hypothetical protein P8452_67596 [Trifolium repens]
MQLFAEPNASHEKLKDNLLYLTNNKNMKNFIKDNLHQNQDYKFDERDEEVNSQDGIKVSFKIKRNTQLKELMNAHCDQQSIELDSIVFLYDGRQFKAEQTPDELVLESRISVHCTVFHSFKS